MKILAIESSCDETAAAVIEKDNGYPIVLSNIVSSQIDIHSKYGGVVPEVAARAHIENIIPVIEEALKVSSTELTDIDRIAVTAGPGLIGSLVVGVETAKAIAQSKTIPLFPINHLEGHIYASFLNTDSEWQKPSFPLVALLVSGGNTLLIYMEDHFTYQVVGQTLDDAAGEAFDKGAKLLGLGYPGGPIISKLAAQGDSNKFDFPIIDLTEKSKRNEEGFLEKAELSLDFSFSGLKTALLNKVKTMSDLKDRDKKDLAAGYEEAIVDTLVQNSVRAVQRFSPKSFILAGGVAANQKLRGKLGEKLKSIEPKLKYIIPNLDLCGDNAAMIGAVGAFRDGKDTNSDFVADPSLKLD